MKNIFTFLALMLIINDIQGQITTNRIRFHYIVTNKKLDNLSKNNIYLMDSTHPTHYKFCEENGFKFKCLVTVDKADKNKLIVDPWRITDKPIKRENDTDKKGYFTLTQTCNGTDIVNATTPYPLFLDIPNRASTGEDTKSIWLHYQTIIIGVNTLGLKFKPEVEDFNHSVYSKNVTSGSINLGINFGYSFGWTRFNERFSNSLSITPGLALGFSSVKLSSEPLKKDVSVKYTTNNLVLSPAFNCILARNDIGIIFAYGYDFMLGDFNEAWAYQGKRFFGIGIAAGFKL